MRSLSRLRDESLTEGAIECRARCCPLSKPGGRNRHMSFALQEDLFREQRTSGRRNTVRPLAIVALLVLSALVH